MTELKWSIRKVSLKKVAAFLLIMCVCITTVGMNVSATSNDGGDVVVKAVKTEDSGTENPPTKTEDSGTVKPEEPGPVVVNVQNVTLSKSSLAMKTGTTATLTATVAPQNATNKTVTWATNNRNVATVTNGVVRAVGNGTARITATAGGKSAVCTVTVTTSVTGVSLSKSAVTIPVNKTATLTATVAPATASNKNISWKSSDTKVATVNSRGVVTAKKAGKATITVTTADGSKKATCTVTVAEVKLNATSMPIQVGKSTTALKVSSKSPSNDTVKSWKSSNTKVATVTSKGKVTGKKVGTAKVTVTMKSGATATCTVKVQKAKVVTKKLTMSSTKLTVQKGKKATLTVARNPISATEKITWKSSNTKVATVTSKGVVKAKKAGTATITAKTSNGKKATCKVTVKNPSVTLSKKSATIKVGKTTTIKVKSTFPKNDKVKSYKSSNTKVATVSNKGVVKGKKAGTATITVTMKSGAKTTFKVTVKK